jgi:beta-glucosidase
VRQTLVVTAVSIALSLAAVSCVEGGDPASDVSLTQSELCTPAQLKPVAVTASANPVQAASKAIDGNTGTRWESAYSDPQWIYVDLGAVKTVTEVKIDWQHAGAKDYRIDVSNDATTWSAAVVTKTGLPAVDHRIDDLTGFSVSARYVRMYGTARATQYGYSIWELYIYDGSSCGGTGTAGTTGSAGAGGTKGTGGAGSGGGGAGSGGSTCPVTTAELPAVAAVASPNPVQAASKAIDGNTGTRWESAYSDPQWIYVDLGAVKTVTEVKIDWQHAGAKDYRIDVSNDATTWSAAIVTKTGLPAVDHRIDDLTGFSVSARYVRMYGTARATAYGYSIWEMYIYGPSSGSSSGNLLTAGWDRSNVTANFTPVNVSTFNPCDVNGIAFDYTGKTFTATSQPPLLEFTQNVTIPQAGTSWRVTFTITGMNDQTDFPPRFLGTLGDSTPTAYAPTTAEVAATGGRLVQVGSLTTGSQLTIDFSTTFNAGDVEPLVIDNVPFFSSSGAGEQKFTVSDVSLARLN